MPIPRRIYYVVTALWKRRYISTTDRHLSPVWAPNECMDLAVTSTENIDLITERRVIVKSKPYFSQILGKAVLGLWMAGAAEAGVIRAVSQDAADLIRVTISWDVADDLESCLIVEELIPAGWVVASPTGNATTHIRMDGVRLCLATGIDPALAPVGSITYALAPGSSHAAGELRFDGRAKTMQNAQEVSIPVEGDQTYVVSDNAELALGQTSTNVSAAASSGHQIDVAARVSWMAVASAPWIEITGGSTGSGNGTVTCRVDDNVGPARRQGTITVSGGGIDCTFTVYQRALRVQVNDFDGDWISDLAVFQPAGGNWSFLYSGGGLANLAFGWAAVVPVPADYDGDGRVDLAVYHPATGNWHVRQSSDNAIVVLQNGGPDQIPALLFPMIHSWFGLP